jgi:hypothetical protein
MSFGFSVGDIILVGRLTYKLYSTITSGRRSAAKDLKELADVLFGLHCALDHLRKAAKDISATASNQQDGNAVGMHKKLDAMINSCGTTVQELESVTKRYGKAAGPDEATDSPATVTCINPHKKRSADRFKQSVQANWARIRWDMERNSLNEYRAKLQAHMDAINIVLTTFLWCVLSHSLIIQIIKSAFLGPPLAESTTKRRRN